MNLDELVSLKARLEQDITTAVSNLVREFEAETPGVGVCEVRIDLADTSMVGTSTPVFMVANTEVELLLHSVGSGPKMSRLV